MQQQFQQNDEKRYDAKKLQQVVELATRLQHEHHETLTAAQVEQMGQDLGLSPEFIRKALVLVEEEEARTVSAPPVRQQVYAAPPVPTQMHHTGRLSKQAIKRALLPGIIYGVPACLLAFLVTPLQRLYPNAVPMFLISSLIVLPPLLALVTGGLQRSRRAGVLGGVAVALAAWLGFVVSSLRSRYIPTNNFDICLMALLIGLPAGAALGGIGALLRRWWDSRPASEEENRHRV
jgi:hypothetical protein